jgi:phosphonate transport system ATP-binding protein
MLTQSENIRSTGAPPAHPVEPAFVLENVKLSYGRNEVLKGISLEIPQGQHVAVIGPSGSGKTTLFRLLSAFLMPTTGNVISMGQSTRGLRGKRLRELRREIGVIYQSDNLIPSLRVVHNVLMGKLGHWWLGRALLSLFWPQQLEGARAALREVEIEEKLWAMPGELSGGQQQRVAIARLLVQKPSVVLADEPVSQLDLRLGREVIELLTRFARQRHSTLLVNLHTLDLLQGNFERVIALREGRVFYDGPPAGLGRQMLAELYGAEYRALHLDQIELEGAP